jgi:hypothetical protein
MSSLKSITSNIDLLKACERYNLPITNIIYKDELKKYNPSTSQAFIIDMHDSKDKSTGHWVLLCKINNKWIYFDSFGIIPPNDILSFCKLSEYNTEQIQNFNSGYCGSYCIVAYYWLKNGKTLRDIQAMFDQYDD